MKKLKPCMTCCDRFFSFLSPYSHTHSFFSNGTLTQGTIIGGLISVLAFALLISFSYFALLPIINQSGLNYTMNYELIDSNIDINSTKLSEILPNFNSIYVVVQYSEIVNIDWCNNITLKWTLPFEQSNTEEEESYDKYYQFTYDSLLTINEMVCVFNITNSSEFQNDYESIKNEKALKKDEQMIERINLNTEFTVFSNITGTNIETVIVAYNYQSYSSSGLHQRHGFLSVTQEVTQVTLSLVVHYLSTNMFNGVFGSPSYEEKYMSLSDMQAHLTYKNTNQSDAFRMTFEVDNEIMTINSQPFNIFIGLCGIGGFWAFLGIFSYFFKLVHLLLFQRHLRQLVTTKEPIQYSSVEQKTTTIVDNQVNNEIAPSNDKDIFEQKERQSTIRKRTNRKVPSYRINDDSYIDTMNDLEFDEEEAEYQQLNETLVNKNELKQNLPSKNTITTNNETMDAENIFSYENILQMTRDIQYLKNEINQLRTENNELKDMLKKDI